MRKRSGIGGNTLAKGLGALLLACIFAASTLAAEDNAGGLAGCQAALDDPVHAAGRDRFAHMTMRRDPRLAARRDGGGGSNQQL